MDQHQDDNEIKDEKAALEPNDNEPELFDESYIDKDNKNKPPLILVVVIFLLILSVFWKKFIATYYQKNAIQVEKPVKSETK